MSQNSLLRALRCIQSDVWAPWSSVLAGFMRQQILARHWMSVSSHHFSHSDHIPPFQLGEACDWVLGNVGGIPALGLGHKIC